MSANVAYLQDSQALDQLQGLFDAQSRAYAANPMPPAAQRQQWLKALRDMLSNERQALIDAISSDFSHRSADETLFAKGDSWIFGANIPGKTNTVMFYMAGLGEYRNELNSVVGDGYRGFTREVSRARSAVKTE